MHAEIIAVGDELTSGQSLDTNSQWIAQRLEELGIATLYHTTVGDRRESCGAVFRAAVERADLVVVTGGLGPTDDDLTRELLAETAGREMILDAESLERIRGMFARRGWPMAPNNERQAMLPAGARAIPNSRGTAPGIDLEIDRRGQAPCRLFALPGVPAEMFEMWRAWVAPAIAEMLGPRRRVIARRKINCFGAGESRIEEMLPDLISRDHFPTVGITASGATIALRIAADGTTENECREAIEPVEELIRRTLGTLVFGADDDQLQDAVARLLRRDGKTIATIESATAGLVANWLAGIADSADFYRGGMVVAALGESVERAAVRCREQFAADYCLAIGLSAPPEKPAGDESGEPPRVTVALAGAGGVARREVSQGIHPAMRQMYVAKQALDFVRLSLLA